MFFGPLRQHQSVNYICTMVKENEICCFYYRNDRYKNNATKLSTCLVLDLHVIMSNLVKHYDSLFVALDSDV